MERTELLTNTDYICGDAQQPVYPENVPGLVKVDGKTYVLATHVLTKDAICPPCGHAIHAKCIQQHVDLGHNAPLFCPPCGKPIPPEFMPPRRLRHIFRDIMNPQVAPANIGTHLVALAAFFGFHAISRVCMRALDLGRFPSYADFAVCADKLELVALDRVLRAVCLSSISTLILFAVDKIREMIIEDDAVLFNDAPDNIPLLRNKEMLMVTAVLLQSAFSQIVNLFVYCAAANVLEGVGAVKAPDLFNQDVSPRECHAYAVRYQDAVIVTSVVAVAVWGIVRRAPEIVRSIAYYRT